MVVALPLEDAVLALPLHTHTWCVMNAAVLVFALLRLDPTPSHEARANELVPVFMDVSDRCGLPVTMLLAVSEEESSLRTRVRSRHGAVGLMGLMPKTVREMLGDHTITREQILEPSTNVMLGCAYMQHLHYRCKTWRRALWRYNGSQPASWGYADRVLASKRILDEVVKETK